MPDEVKVPEALSGYVEITKPLDVAAAAALKKWAHLLPLAEHKPRKRCCCCCCCEEGSRNEKEFAFGAQVDLWVDPRSGPRRIIVDLYAEFTWTAPAGSKVTIEMEQYRPDGSIQLSWSPIGPTYVDLPSSGFAVWDPPPSSSYGHRICFRAVTSSGLVSNMVCYTG